MAKQPADGFAALLQRLRISAGMTQDELAKAAEVSPRTVSDLERGINRTARKDTAELLATAIGLTGQERERFLAAARGKPSAAGSATSAGAAAGVPPAAPGVARAEADGSLDDSAASNLGWLDSAVTGNFEGRQRELGVLAEAWSRATAGHRVLTLVGGEPGIGKTALTGELARLAHADKGLVLYGRWDEHILAPTRHSVRRWPITRGPAPRHYCAMT